MGNANTLPESEEEEWLQDLQDSQTLDFSRQVNHSQFIKHIQGEFSESCLTDLPWTLLEHVNLFTRVNGAFNSITHLSPNLALRIPHLTHLNLSYNSIVEIPATIGLLLHLTELLLRENRLQELPDEIILMKQLQLLDVSRNYLSKLPKDLGKLENLSKLNVSYNYLEAIPLSLGSAPKLSVLLASNNLCVKPPQPICDYSSELLNYLRNHTHPVLIAKQLNHFPRVRFNIARSQLSGDPRSQYAQSQTRTTLPSSRTKTPLLLPPNATQLSVQTLSDKIVGLIYGAVLGDTLGVATEFLPHDDIDFYYSDGRLCHESIVQDEHRSHFQRGKTTCVSDLMLLILESMIQWSGVLDELEIARRLVDYSLHGLKDCNSRPFITSTVINKLVVEERYPMEPHTVSMKLASSFQAAVCEDLHALPMAIVTGLPQFYNLDEVACNAQRICKTTHNDPVLIRCASNLAVTVAMIMQGYEVEEIISKMDKPTDDEATNVQGEEAEDIWRTVLNCLQTEINFESSLAEILFLGGQTRIYGAICGGVLGCLTGYSNLPSHWLAGLHSSLVGYLNERLNHLLDMMALP